MRWRDYTGEMCLTAFVVVVVFAAIMVFYEAASSNVPPGCIQSPSTVEAMFGPPIADHNGKMWVCSYTDKGTTCWEMVTCYVP